MLRTTVVMVALASSTLAADEGKQRTFTFGKDDLGIVPTGWKAAKTGKGEGSVWKIVEDQTAPSKNGYVLAQTAEGPNSLFNICVLEDCSFKDVELSVSSKPIAGKNDQRGGIVWRYQDNKDYYLARLNPVDNTSSFAVYKVENGRRSQFQGKRLPKIRVGEWHTLKIKMAGDQLECYLDGKKELEVKDLTFKEAGKVGLWQSRTHKPTLTTSRQAADDTLGQKKKTSTERISEKPSKRECDHEEAYAEQGGKNGSGGYGPVDRRERSRGRRAAIAARGNH
jgi:hypothetical protein